MQQKEQTKLVLEEQIKIINEKLDKLQEYNKIADITNQVFEKRLCNIENAIKQINKTISA